MIVWSLLMYSELKVKPVMFNLSLSLSLCVCVCVCAVVSAAGGVCARDYSGSGSRSPAARLQE